MSKTCACVIAEKPVCGNPRCWHFSTNSFKIGDECRCCGAPGKIKKEANTTGKSTYIHTLDGKLAVFCHWANPPYIAFAGRRCRSSDLFKPDRTTINREQRISSKKYPDDLKRYGYMLIQGN